MMPFEDKLQEIHDHLKKNEFFCEILMDPWGDELKATILVNGDWKHDHARLDFLMQQIGWGKAHEYMHGDSNEDFYESEHEYIEIK